MTTSTRDRPTNQELISTLPTLSIDDLLNQPNIVWHRNRIVSREIRSQARIFDRLAHEGKIKVTGEWIRRPAPIKNFVEYNQAKDRLPYKARNQTRSRITEATQLTMIERFPGYDWCFIALLRRTDITYNVAKTVCEAHQCNVNDVRHMKPLSRSIDLTRFTDADYQLPWVREGLSCNRTLTLALIDRFDNTQLFPNVQGEWNKRLLHRILPIDDLLELCRRTRRCLMRGGASRNRNIDYNTAMAIDAQVNQGILDAVEEWDPRNLTYRTDIETILAHPEVSWDIIGICAHPIEDLHRWIAQNPDKLISVDDATRNVLAKKLPISSLYRYNNRQWPLVELVTNPCDIRVDDIYRLVDPTVLAEVGFVLPKDRKLTHGNVAFSDIAISVV